MKLHSEQIAVYQHCKLPLLSDYMVATTSRAPRACVLRNTPWVTPSPHLENVLEDATTILTAGVNVDFPARVVESLDREAARIGVTRQSIIKVWLVERLKAEAANKPLNGDAASGAH